MKKFLFLLVISGFMLSCGNTRQVLRIDEDQTVDLSGRWNDSDSRLVAEEMVSDGLSRVWLTDFLEKNGEKPVVIVGDIKNKTSEHISAETFIKDLEREFINSGKVRIVQSGEARDQMREERSDQQNYSSLDSMKKWGLEKGADYMLTGTINSITDEYGREKVVFYQVDLELSDLETNETVWVGNKKIKKAIID
jgi:uncharacterized protein (TIGR02722 family)